MASYPLPYPTRRRSARTPPFVPPLPPQEPEENSNAPGLPPVQPQQRQGGFWQNLINNPAVAAYAAGAAQRLLQPQQFGQTTTGHIVGGLLGGFNDVAQQRILQAQMAAAGREEGRKERQVQVQEAGERRLGAEQRSTAQAREARTSREGAQLQLEGRRTTAEEARVENERVRMVDAQVRADRDHEMAKKRLDIAERQLSVSQQQLNALTRQRAEENDLSRARIRTSEATVAVARSRLEFDKAEAVKEAIRKQDIASVNLLKIAYDQAAKEVDSLAKASLTGADITPEKLIETSKARANEIYEDLKKRTGVGTTVPVTVQEAASTPVKPGGEIRVRIKSSGQTGTVDASEFDPRTMEKI